MTTTWQDTGRFVREFVRDPLHVASVTPSSPTLAAAMARALPGDGDPVVVELGPGTGAFTRAIQERLGGRGMHLAIEMNAEWVRLLTERHPAVDAVEADAADLPRLLAERGIAGVDAVVSGLPWVAWVPGPDGRGLHDVVTEVMTPDGVFTQVAYAWTRWAPPARRQLASLRAHFTTVEITPTIWRNVPPAVVYEARGPRSAA